MEIINPIAKATNPEIVSLAAPIIVLKIEPVPLTEAEQKILNETKQQTLITKKELASMKAPYLDKEKKYKPSECILHFYKCLSGEVGPENQRDRDFAPKPLKGSSAQNQRAFLGCAAVLRRHSDIISGTKKGSQEQFMVQVFYKDCLSI